MIGCKMTSVFDQAALIVMQLMNAKKGEIKASKKTLLLSCVALHALLSGLQFDFMKNGHRIIYFTRVLLGTVYKGKKDAYKAEDDYQILERGQMIVEAIIEGSLDDVSIDELKCLSSIVDDAHHHAHDTSEECFEFWCTGTISYLLSEANRKWK